MVVLHVYNSSVCEDTAYVRKMVCKPKQVSWFRFYRLTLEFLTVAKDVAPYARNIVYIAIYTNNFCSSSRSYCTVLKCCAQFGDCFVAKYFNILGKQVFSDYILELLQKIELLSGQNKITQNID